MNEWKSNLCLNEVEFNGQCKNYIFKFKLERTHIVYKFSEES